MRQEGGGLAYKPCRREGEGMEKEVLFTREQIQERVRELARRISEDYQGSEPLVVGILNGAVFFFADLVRELALPVTIDFLRAASYGAKMSSSGQVRLAKDLEQPVQGRPVILVEDIVDTGLTLRRVVDLIRERGPSSLSVCVLLDKIERREVEVPLDYVGFRIEKGFVVGYGLDYNEQYRQLPEIFVLKP